MTSVTKLTNVNYMMWSKQVRALLEGHELQRFIDTASDAPSPTILIDGITTPNPAYTPWRCQDRSLFSSLIGAISLPVQSVVSTAMTSREVWSILTKTFGNPTRGHIHQLKLQIKSCVKGTKKNNEYLRIIKSKSDELSLLGKPMDAEDLIENLLGCPKNTSQILMWFMDVNPPSPSPSFMSASSIGKQWWTHQLLLMVPTLALVLNNNGITRTPPISLASKINNKTRTDSQNCTWVDATRVTYKDTMPSSVRNTKL